MLDEQLKRQHRHFGIDYSGPPRILDAAEEKFRVAAILEELSELVLADSLEDKYDALLDTIVFAAGTLERMGLQIDAGLDEVIQSNLRKTLGPNKKRGGFKLDLVKPEGWQEPNLRRLLDESNRN